MLPVFERWTIWGMAREEQKCLSGLIAWLSIHDDCALFLSG
jgi:hypothetical protein